jgi:hypothetical protein
LDALAYCIENKLEYGFRYLFFFLKTDKKLEKKIYKRSHPIYIVWKWVFEYHKKIMKSNVLSDVLNVLFEWYNTYKFREQWLFVAQAVAYLIKRDELDFYICELPKVVVYKSYIPHFKTEKIDIDEYCIDKHTYEGRKKGKSNIDFAIEGSYVENEIINLVGRDYREIFLSLHFLWDDRTKTFDYKPPPQKLIEKYIKK